MQVVRSSVGGGWWTRYYGVRYWDWLDEGEGEAVGRIGERKI